MLLAIAGCKPGKITITANDQLLGLYEGSQVDITLSATASDNSNLQYQIHTPPRHGTVTGTAPQLLYTPYAGFTGDDELLFVATSGNSTSVPATIKIIVAPNQTLSAERPTPVAISLAQSTTPTDIFL
ncbi:MAG: Ig-like domain-containing protein [Gammaproteobacteria bacterium]